MPHLKAGEGESRVPIGLNLGVDVAAHIQQEFDGGRVAVHGGQHKRRDAQLGPGPRVDLGPVGQQQLDDVGVAAARRQRQRRVVAHVAVLFVGAAAQQDLDDLVAAAAAGQRQRGVLGPLRLRLNVRSMVQ